ncbi:putative growth-regulating factor 14 isoform X2 [Zea mays]|uniref:Growth-regulating factor n=3 Tax=Zea mays TaxID=4577 RepID=C0HFG7_MAIZE|eukprot:XP_008647265.1 putative growth-regulating factor 14 isoform X2 [Zea mays]
MLSSASSAAGAAMGMGGGGYAHQPPPQRTVFTAAQWAELEQQALIYKYLMAGVPVPPDLLLPVRPGPAAAFSFAGPAAASPFYHQHHPSLSYYAYYGKKLDPEPWRCRRTDGKKWRCSKEAHPDSKYCERHMHRGRNRSRKPVESKTASSSSPAHPSPPQLSTVTTTAPLEPLAAAGGKVHGLSLGGGAAGSSHLGVDASNAHYRYGSKYPLGAKPDGGELSFFSGASSGNNSRGGFTIDSPSDNNSWHSALASSVPPFTLSTKSGDSGLLPGAYASYSQSHSHMEPPRELGQVTIASLAQEQERQQPFSGGMLGNVKQENQNQPLRPFFDEWPGTRADSWPPEMDGAPRAGRTSFSSSTTQLSISIPMPRCD